MSNTIRIYLAAGQKEHLAPLFKQVHEGFLEEKKGLILGQIHREHIEARFIPYEYAIRMVEIMKEMDENPPEKEEG